MQRGRSRTTRPQLNSRTVIEVVAKNRREPQGSPRFVPVSRVSVAGTVKVLSQTFRVGKRHRGLYVRLVLDTQRDRPSASLDGRLLKRWPYKLTNK